MIEIRECTQYDTFHGYVFLMYIRIDQKKLLSVCFTTKRVIYSGDCPAGCPKMSTLYPVSKYAVVSIAMECQNSKIIHAI